MGVTSLGGADGMLFRFGADHSGSFWMKDTILPLSIAFFAGDGAFVSATDMEPCPPDSESCPALPGRRSVRRRHRGRPGRSGVAGHRPGKPALDHRSLLPTIRPVPFYRLDINIGREGCRRANCERERGVFGSSGSEFPAPGSARDRAAVESTAVAVDGGVAEAAPAGLELDEVVLHGQLGRERGAAGPGRDRRRHRRR